MTTYAVLGSVAFLASLLTFFSGFGLGTLLTPVFILFFPVDVAIALTAIVHFVNNLFKLILVGRQADGTVVWRFGFPAVLAALFGAWCLLQLSDLPPLFDYQLASKQVDVSPVKFIIGCLLILFALLEILPALQKIRFSRNKLILGGLLSGFFGGISGHQGALRSMFLIKTGLSKESFIATGVVIAILVDLTRLSVYSSHFVTSGLGASWPLVLCTSLFAIAGAYTGNKLLRKVTLTFVQRLVGLLLVIIGLLLAAGLI